MALYVARRLALGLLALLGVSVAAFAVMHLVPGDPVRIMVGVRATPEQVELLRERLGLDAPLPAQYLDFLRGAVTLDFGESMFKNAPVGSLIGPRMLVTLQLVAYGLTLAVLAAIPLGVLSAVRRNRPADHSVRVVSMFAFSMPAFWVGLLLILVFAVNLGWFPTSGLDDGVLGRIYSLTLPAITLALGVSPLLVRTLRASMIDTLGSEFIEAASARGLSRGRVLFKHALRASLTSTLTVLGVFLGALLGGTVVIEAIFDLPGMGALLLEGVTNRDFPVVQATVLLFGAGVILANLLTDLAYALIDPRVREA